MKVSTSPAVFNLNGGEGSAIVPITNLKAGDEITLPECDATKDGKVFAGWNDGKNIYRPGDKYVILTDTVFYAQYVDAPEPMPEKGDDGNTGLIVIASIVVILAILGIVAFVGRHD